MFNEEYYTKCCLNRKRQKQTNSNPNIRYNSICSQYEKWNAHKLNDLLSFIPRGHLFIVYSLIRLEYLAGLADWTAVLFFLIKTLWNTYYFSFQFPLPSRCLQLMYTVKDKHLSSCSYCSVCFVVNREQVGQNLFIVLCCYTICK